MSSGHSRATSFAPNAFFACAIVERYELTVDAFRSSESSQRSAQSEKLTFGWLSANFVQRKSSEFGALVGERDTLGALAWGELGSEGREAEASPVRQGIVHPNRRKRHEPVGVTSLSASSWVRQRREVIGWRS